MTVSTTVARASFVGNGSTSQFPCPFKAFDEEHIQVYLDGVLQVDGVDYTVSGLGNDTTEVMFISPPLADVIVNVFRILPLTQETDYLANDEFPAETHERALDLLTMGIQQVQAASERVVRNPIVDAATLDMELPPAAQRANLLLGFDAIGEPVAVDVTDQGMFNPTLAYLWTGQQVFSQQIPLELQFVDAGSDYGPILPLFRDSGSPATNDLLGRIDFEGRAGAGARQRYASINASIHDFGANEGQMDFVWRIAGSLINGFRLDNTGGIVQAQAISFADGAGEGPYLAARRRSPTPGANDFIGAMTFPGHNSDLNSVNYGKIAAQIVDPTAGSEDGALDMSVMVAGQSLGIFGLRSFGLVLIRTGVQMRTGSGNPEGAVAAPQGSTFLRTDGGNDTTLYVKASGAGNTGWRAVTTAAP